MVYLPYEQVASRSRYSRGRRYGGLKKLAMATDELDGYWWQTLDKLDKLQYVVGFLEGYSVAFAHFNILPDIISIEVEPTPKDRDGKGEKLKKEIVDKFLLPLIRSILTSARENYDLPSEITFGKLVDKIDEFYKDELNKNILVLGATTIVMKKLRGESDESIETIENFYRNPQDEEAQRQYLKVWLKEIKE